MALIRCPWMLEYRRQRHRRLFLHPQPISPLHPMHPGLQLSSLVLERANYCLLQVRNIRSTLLQYRRYNAAHRGLGDSPQFLRVSGLPRPPKLPRTIDRCEFFFWVPPAAHRQTLNCKQGPTTNRFLVSDATIPVLRGYRRRIWNECCAIATIHVTKWYAGFSSWRERNTCADELN